MIDIIAFSLIGTLLILFLLPAVLAIAWLFKKNRKFEDLRRNILRSLGAIGIVVVLLSITLPFTDGAHIKFCLDQQCIESPCP